LSSSIIPAITNVQFFQQLANAAAITQAEALAAVGRGAIPPAFQRAHPVMDALSAVLRMNAEQMDEVFIMASRL